MMMRGQGFAGNQEGEEVLFFGEKESGGNLWTSGLSDKQNKPLSVRLVCVI